MLLELAKVHANEEGSGCLSNVVQMLCSIPKHGYL